jgi:uncharacterized membrane protein
MVVDKFHVAGVQVSPLLGFLVILVGFILWILLIIRAYQGEKFQVPVAAGIAQSLLGK